MFCFQRATAWSVGDVDSGIGPKDTFDESAQVLSPCEDDINRGLDDGRVVGRIGVQVDRVESESNKEGACDMLCQDVKMDCFCETHNASSVLEPRDKNSRVQVRRVRAGSVQCSHTVACKGIAIACKRYTLVKNNVSLTPFWFL